MKKPVHYDVDAEVEKIRLELEGMVPLAKIKAKTPRDLELIACQELYHPLILLSIKINLKAKNAGTDLAILAISSGLTLGQIAAMSFEQSLGPMCVLGPFFESYNSGLGNDSTKKIKISHPIHFTPTTGGNA